MAGGCHLLGSPNHDPVFQTRFLNVLRLLCLTLTLDFSFLFCLLLHFFSGYFRAKERQREKFQGRAHAREEKRRLPRSAQAIRDAFHK